MTLTVTPPPTQGSRLADVARRALASPDTLSSIVRAERAEAKRRGRTATDSGTSVVTAADDDGNAVVIVHSNSFPQFASGIVLDNGLILNNRAGRGFDLAAPADAVTAPAAGRVPPTTLHGWVLAQGSQLTLGATPGGVNQLPWNVQLLLDILRSDDLATAVTSPRWALDSDDVLTAEEGADTDEAEPTLRLPPLSLRSAQQVVRIASDGLHTAAADPRAGAAALALY